MPAFPAYKTKPYYDSLSNFLAVSIDLATGELKDAAVQEKVAAAIAAEPTVVTSAETAAAAAAGPAAETAVNTIIEELQRRVDNLEAATVPAEVQRTVHAIGDLHLGYTLQSRVDDFTADLPAVWSAAAERVLMGDLIDDISVDPTADTEALDVAENKVQGWRVTVGNHDLTGGRDRADWQDIYGTSGNWTRDLPGTNVRLIGVSPDTGITLSASTLTWLETRIEETTRDVVIFAHAPLSGANNYTSTSYTMQPSASIAAILTGNTHVRAWVSGHTHNRYSDSHQLDWFEVASGQYLWAINVGAIAYETRTANQADQADDANVSAFLSVYDDHIKVRYRDHAAGAWTTWNWNDEVLLGFDGGPVETYSGAVPLLFLSPGTSRDTAGTITPVTGGTLTTEAGVYGTAWNFTNGYVRALIGAQNARIRVDHGTILMRGTMPDAAVDTRGLFYIDYNSGSNNVITMEHSNLPDQLNLVANMYPAGVTPTTTNGNLNYWPVHGNPLPETFTDLTTYALRWKDGVMNVAVIDHEYQRSTGRPDWGAAYPDPARYINVGAVPINQNFAQMRCESFVILDQYITDYELNQFANQASAWTWATLGGS